MGGVTGVQIPVGGGIFLHTALPRLVLGLVHPPVPWQRGL